MGSKNVFRDPTKWKKLIFSKNLSSRICLKVDSDYPRDTCENVVNRFHVTIQRIITSYFLNLSLLLYLCYPINIALKIFFHLLLCSQSLKVSTRLSLFFLFWELSELDRNRLNFCAFNKCTRLWKLSNVYYTFGY